jgi:hypothetical protein
MRRHADHQCDGDYDEGELRLILEACPPLVEQAPGAARKPFEHGYAAVMVIDEGAVPNAN